MANKPKSKMEWQPFRQDTLAPETLYETEDIKNVQTFDFTHIPFIDMGRYTERGYFGKGGMGEVKRVFDNILGREVAMKIMRLEYTKDPKIIAKFIEEAQATAQLQHPSIVPIYDIGRMSDDRLCFTMKEITGQTLEEVIKLVHEESKFTWEITHTGWHLRKLVGVFRQVCEAVSYAHERGVVHRDIKPQNIMLGQRGEVWVVDWGLVKILKNELKSNKTELGNRSSSSNFQKLNIVTHRSQDDTQGTLLGTISGTPAYMSPEQSRGDDQLDTRTDIYSLGAVLYEILCGVPPYGLEDKDSLSLVRKGPPLSVVEALIKNRITKYSILSDNAKSSKLSKTNLLTNLSIPKDLIKICEKAMQRNKSSRYPNVRELIGELSPWLEGTKQRTQALKLIQESQNLAYKIESLSTKVIDLRNQAQVQQEHIELWKGEDEKAVLWALEDEANVIEKEITVQRIRREILLRSALQHSSDVLEAHLALAQMFKESHERAERLGESTLNSELSLQETLHAIPDQHPTKQSILHYLKGDAALTLITDPVGAEVFLYSFELYNRRLVPKFIRSLGYTPLIKIALPPGSYLCKIKHSQSIEVHYPIYLERGQHWDGIPPEGGSPFNIYLPRLGELSENECYIPAGWFWSGGDSHSPKPLPKRRLWCDPLVYQRFPITNQQYMNFLHDLVAQGEEEKALMFAPREDGTNNDLSTLIYHYSAGKFSFKQEEKWAKWQDDWPVFSVDWFGANAYAAWASKRGNHTWRLPGDLEWEKITRGVDGRAYPWGEYFDPSWACMRDSHPNTVPSPASIYDFPFDESIYGVRGVSGNTRIWCADIWEADGPPLTSARVPKPVEIQNSQTIYRTLRGGSWYNSATFLRACYRFDAIDTLRFRLLGFRLARSFSPKEK